MTGLIKPIGKRKSRFIPPEEAMRRLDEIAVEEPPAQDEQQSNYLSGATFSIESLADRYVLHGICYDGLCHNVALAKTHFNGGEMRRREKWLDISDENGFSLPDASLVYEIINRLYQNREHPDAGQKELVNEVGRLLIDDMEEEGITTCTTVKYNPYSTQGLTHLDEVVHNDGYIDCSHEFYDLVGRSGPVNSSIGLEPEIQALIGTSNLEQVEEVLEWLTGIKPLLLRRGQRPKQEESHQVVFCFSLGAKPDHPIIRAYYAGEQEIVPARGIIVHREALPF